MKLFQNKMIKGTLILTIAGIITRFIGFYYKIFLADILGARLLGTYQLIFPVYGICFTIYAAGIQTAISQLIGTSSGKKDSHSMSPLKILVYGCLLSLCLSLFMSAIIYTGADWIAANIILEPACTPYLKIISLLFPFCGVSACICGYYYGIQNASVPAGSQIIEQLARVAFVFLICALFGADENKCCIIAVWGIVIGEIAGFLFNFIKLIVSITSQRKLSGFKDKKKSADKNLHKKHPVFKSLIILAVTLTSTKLIVSLLHSAESIFIPAALTKYGCTSSEALSIYGMLSGMAMPFILFPTAISNAFATMLLPAVAKSQAENDTAAISKSVTFAVKYSLLIGWLFVYIFIIHGNNMGTLFFHNKTAGSYIVTLAWLCPFIYISTTLTGIINGMGHTQLTFIMTVVSLIVKIYSLVALVPVYGIKAYLMGMLISQILMTFMEVFYLKEYIIPDTVHWIIIPCVSLMAVGFLSDKLSKIIISAFPYISGIFILFIICCFIALSYIIILWISGCISKDFKRAK